MKAKRILSFVCVLALVLTMCSVFTFATQPETEVEIESEITPRYTGYGRVTSSRTYLYNRASTSSGYAYNGVIPVGTRVYVYETIDAVFHRVRVTLGGTQYTGYVLMDNITLD